MHLHEIKIICRVDEMTTVTCNVQLFGLVCAMCVHHHCRVSITSQNEKVSRDGFREGDERGIRCKVRAKRPPRIEIELVRVMSRVGVMKNL